MRFSSAFAVAVSLSFASICYGQAKPAQVEDLRRQIEAMKKQLDTLEAPAPSQKVTQIGGSRSRPVEANLVVRVYDLSDLFAIAPPYAAFIGDALGLSSRPIFPEAGDKNPSSGGGGMGGGFGGAGGGAGFFNVRQGQPAQAGEVAASAKTSIEELIDSIQKTIAPDSWNTVGGPASVARLGTSLIISADANSHDQIEALFTLLRQRWGTLRTVSINAWWLWLNDQQLAKLLPGNGKGDTGVEGIKAFGVVEEALWQQFFAPQADGNKPASGAYRAVITCYNGQTVNSTSGAEQGVVNEIEPVLTQGGDDKPQGRIGYRPTVTPIQEGTALQITPLVNTSGKFVVLDVHSRVAVREPSAKEKRRAAQDDDPSPLAVIGALDRPRLLTQRLATTLRIPVDRVMLIGGMPLSAKPQPGDPTLYLFVRATIQELRDDAKPAAVEPVQEKDKKVPAKEEAP